MRKAKYDMRRVICKNSSCIGNSSNIAKPGFWIVYCDDSGKQYAGRVLGRIAETDRDGKDCAGHLAVMRLHTGMRSAGIAWVHPDSVRDVYEHPPAALLEWITGPEWVKSAADIARIIAMDQHGTTCESFIDSRHAPDKAYNSRPEYVQQWILK